jgi:hypothetical protein
MPDDDKRWDDRTDRMTFEVRRGDATVSSVWTNSVRNAFRKQAGWAKLQGARAAAAKHWTAPGNQRKLVVRFTMPTRADGEMGQAR